MINTYSKITYKAYSASCINVKYHQNDNSFYFTWDKPKKRRPITTERDIESFMSDTFYLLVQYRIAYTGGDFKPNIYIEYLEKWGSFFYTPNNKIYFYDILSQSYLLNSIEVFLYFIEQHELVPPLEELFHIWVNDLKKIGTPLQDNIPSGYLLNTLNANYWVFMPSIAENHRSFWFPSKTKPSTKLFFLTINKPNFEDIQEMLENPTFKYNYFKKGVLQNIELFINRYTQHNIAIDENGNLNIESTCSSLLVFYLFTRLGNLKMKNFTTCICGNPLEGRQKRFCSQKCKDDFYNKTDRKRVDRWINRKKDLGKIPQSLCLEIRKEAKLLFDEGFTETEVREELIKRYF